MCIWSYEAIVWVWAQHQMPLIGIPGNATGLLFGKEVQQALGSFWYLLGTAECGAMSETRKLAAILAADVVGYSRLAGADEDRTLARLRAPRSDLIADLPIVNSPRRSPVVSTSLSISSSPAMSPISTTSTSFPEWESLAKSSVAKPSW